MLTETLQSILQKFSLLYYHFMLALSLPIRIGGLWQDYLEAQVFSIFPLYSMFNFKCILKTKKRTDNLNQDQKIKTCSTTKENTIL